MPAFGPTSSASSSKTAFGASSPQPAFGTPIFNQNGGSAFKQTQPTSHDNAFSRSSLFGPQSQSSFSTATVLTPSITTAFGKSTFCGTTPLFRTQTFPSGSPVFNQNSGSALQHTQPTSHDNAFSKSSLFGPQSQPSFSTATLLPPSTTKVFGKSTLCGMTPLFGTQTFPSGSAYFNQNGGSAFQQTQPTSHDNAFSRSSLFGAQSQSFSSTATLLPPSTTKLSGKSTLCGTIPCSGAQTFPSGFGHAVVDGLAGGSKGTRYAETLEKDGNGAKIESICAMKSYLNKSHEELRLEDYRSGDKGGIRHTGQSPDAIHAVSSWANHSSSSVAPSKTSSFASPAVYSNPFAPRTPTSNPFQNPFTSLTPANISGFGHAVVDGLFGGSRVTRYAATPENDGNGAKIESLCAMKPYLNKSHEELKLEDYRFQDKGGNRHTGQSPDAIGVVSSWANRSSSSLAPLNTSSFVAPLNTSSLVAPLNTSSFTFPAVNSNPFAPRIPTFNPLQTANFIGTAGTSDTFSPPCTGAPPSNAQSPSLNYFSSNQLVPPTPPFSSLGFNASTAALNSTSSDLFPSITSCPMSSISSTSTIMSVQHPASGPPISTSPSGLVTMPSFPSFSFVKSTPAPEITSTFYSQPAQPFQSFAPSTTPYSIQQKMSSSSPIDMNPWGNFSSSTTGSGGSDLKGVGGQSIEEQEPATGSTVAMQQLAVTNPFGTPNVVQISIGHPVTAVSTQYGISSRPVSDNLAPVRRSSLLRVRQLSLTRNWLPALKNNAKSGGPKVPFFADEEKPDSFKAGASFIPRENPRSWTLSPSVLKSDLGKSSEVQSTIVNLHEDGTSGGTTEVHDHNSCKEEDLNVKIHGNQYDKAACVYGHDVDVESVIPSLQHADYYTVPSVEFLAAKEKVEPGFCCHVKDFVVGRHGYGSIKFLGETDIRKLELDSLVCFNYREVTVYMDESKRPPVGQGLNKPAEVTLLNVKCIGKNTGKQYIDGPNVVRYKEMLIKKAMEQGAEFISYDPVVGEWKFKVQHF